MSADNLFRAIPALEQLLQRADMRLLTEQHGRHLVRKELREASQRLREALAQRGAAALPADISAALTEETAQAINAQTASTHQPVFNLTGTVLHTNLGRAILPETAIEALVNAARHPCPVEFDLDTGRRGDRDTHVESWLRRLTGAPAATVVNNNAAAVLLCLSTLTTGREVPVSRGELVEIGGAFRMPDIMMQAGCVLVEVGTTNRTHLVDFERAINERTAALMTVHTSNYVIQGFTKTVPEAALAELAHRHHLPFIHDLGSGTLIDLTQFGLPHEPTVQEALTAGADLVTFSGDKLLGGPQCGIIVGRVDLIARLKRNPLKRALRVDKLTLAALEAVLRLYIMPERLGDHLPALRQLIRDIGAIKTTAKNVLQACRQTLSQQADFSLSPCQSQIGSGALPVDTLSSVAIAITPHPREGERHSGALQRWMCALRALSIPIIGRVHGDKLLLDMRCLEDEVRFIRQLEQLPPLLESEPC